jgi:dTDP-glucose 4,6-dehydratase/UDP-glucuronate decarboxylase
VNRGTVPKQLALVYDDIRQVVEDVGRALYRLSGKTFLLTGTSGFLASYMADTIVWLNDNVFSSPCLLIAGVRSAVARDERLSHLLNRKDVQFVQQNVSAPIYLDKHVDFIVHVASKASPRSYLAHPLDTMDANTVGTRQLLEIAKEQGVESFLFFSSGEIYGEVTNEFVPTPEIYPGSTSCIGPRACYTESKRYGETLCVTYWREYQVPVKIVRPFHVYGPGLRLDDGRVIADFLRNRLQNKPIQVLSDGSGIRAFCYIADATAGFWKVLFSDYNGEPFNIGNDQEPVSIRDLAYLVASLEEPELPVNFETSVVPEHLCGTPSRVCPDISKANHLLNYHPRVRLREGLVKTLNWHRARSETGGTD